MTRFSVASLVALALLSGCSRDYVRLVDTLKLGFGVGSDSGADVQPDPRFASMKVAIRDGLVGRMILGYQLDDPAGPLEIWFSGSREVIRIQHGRVVGTAGFSSDWVATRFKNLPTWAQLTDEPAYFERERDVSPGHRYGIKERMMIRRIAQPNSVPVAPALAQRLVWFQELAVVSPEPLPPVLYGVDFSVTPPKVVFSDLCIDKDFCLTWQRLN